MTLDGSASLLPGWGTIISYQWVESGGPRIAVANANAALASFNLPAKLLANGGTTLVFQFTVKNSLGLSSTSSITITANRRAIEACKVTPVTPSAADRTRHTDSPTRP